MATMTEEERAYWESVWQECRNDDPVRAKITRTFFVSRSNGRNRPPRKERDVELLGYNGRFWQVTDAVPNGLDRVLEAEVLDHCPPDKTPYQHLLDTVRQP